MRNYVSRKWYKGKDHRKFSYSKDVDKELVPMLDVFNNIPGVRTVFSFCGHSNINPVSQKCLIYLENSASRLLLYLSFPFFFFFFPSS